MVCTQPRAESLSLAFSELTIYKIANFQLRSSRLRLDSALLQTPKRGRRFAFPIQRCGLRDDADGRATSLLPFPLEAKPHISDGSCKENIRLRLMRMQALIEKFGPE